MECTRPPTPTMRVKMYSQYKSRWTFKFLVACAPSGEITFVSRSFGGRTTDSGEWLIICWHAISVVESAATAYLNWSSFYFVLLELTVKSGFINLVEPGDLIMADKGTEIVLRKHAEYSPYQRFRKTIWNFFSKPMFEPVNMFATVLWGMRNGNAICKTHPFRRLPLCGWV